MKNKTKQTEDKSSGNCASKNSFNINAEIKIGRTIFLLKRHFHGNQNLKETMYQVIKNEAKRQRNLL